MNSEPCAPRSIIGIIITTWAVGILIGLAAGKAIWKKPCDHPEIPVFVAYIPTNDLVQIRTNVKRILQEMYDTPKTNTAPEYILLEKNNGTFQVLTNVELVDLMVYGLKLGEQATNSP